MVQLLSSGGELRASGILMSESLDWKRLGSVRAAKKNLWKSWRISPFLAIDSNDFLDIGLIYELIF